MLRNTDRSIDLPARLFGVEGAVYRGVLAATLAALAYLAVLAAYLATTGVEVVDPSRAGYPLVWFSVGAAALAATTAVGGRGGNATTVGDTPRWAVGVALGYVLLLAGVSGLVSSGATGVGVSVAGALPGWGPIVLADLGVLAIAIVPFQAVGYVVLGYIPLQHGLMVIGVPLPHPPIPYYSPI